MTCADFEIVLSDYVDGTVSVEQRRTIEAHADSCTDCRELLRDVFQAVTFLESVDEVAPPPELITRLVYQAPQGRHREEHERRGFFSSTLTNWLQPVLQPRMAMGMAMTILSFAMLGKCTGIHVQQVKAADLNPIAIWNGFEDKAMRTWDRSVKYYENLRLVYEMETTLKELREQQETVQNATSPSQSGQTSGRSQTNGGTQK